MTDNVTESNDATKNDTKGDVTPSKDKADTAPELASLLAKISNRIAETNEESKEEEINEAPVGAMRDRLESLRDQATAAREHVKVKEHDTFASVEAALEKLSEQVDADARESAKEKVHGNSDESAKDDWNDDDAEALTNHCEKAGLAEAKAEKDLLIVGDQGSASAVAAAEGDDPVNYVYLQPSAKEIGQQWFEDRFEELAGRLDAAVATKPEEAGSGYADLMAKMDALEERLTVLLGTPSGEDDAEGRGALQDIEMCIAEIATQLEATSLELKRIETLENQITELTESFATRSSIGTGGENTFDAMAIADIISEKLSQNAPAISAGAAAGTPDSINDLSVSVKEFIRERRNDGEHANALLDTMQQTIMRLLDRMDALEKTGSMSGLISAPHVGAAASTPAEKKPRETAQSKKLHAEPAVAPKVQTAAQLERPAGVPSLEMPSLEVPSEGAIDPQLQAGQSFGRKQKALDEPSAAKPVLKTDDIDDDAMSLDRLQQVVGELEDVEAATPEQAAAGGNRVGRNRGDFITAARRAAAKAGNPESGRSGTDTVLAERARLTAQARRIENDDLAELNDDDDGEEIESTRDGFSLGALGSRFRSKKKKGNGRTRLLVVTLTLVAVGLGASKFIMSQSSDAARQQLQSQQLQQQGSQRMGDKASLPGNYVQPAQMQPTRQLAQRAAPPTATYAPITTPQTAPQTGAVSIDQNGRLGNLVQPAAVNPATSQADNNQSVSGGRAKVGERELPSMLVGPLSLRLAAASGDASAEFQVASRFADGSGVQQDFNEALKWYGRSASRGFALAQYRLGTFHERGLGVPKDIARARIWYQRAAASDNIKAMHNLAVLAASPKAGKPDYTTAAGWFSKAAERGLADSQFNLAILYQNGLGVARSEAEAYKWFSLAAGSGDGEAVKRMTELAGKLGSNRVQQLDAATRKWKRKPANKLSNDPHHAGQAWQRSTSGA